MLQNKEMSGGGSGKRLKRVLESILLLVKYSFSMLYVNQLHWSKLYDPLKLDIYCTLPEEYVIRYKSMMLYIPALKLFLTGPKVYFEPALSPYVLTDLYKLLHINCSSVNFEM